MNLPKNQINLYYCYADEDINYVIEIDKQFSVLKSKGLKTWYRGKILGGQFKQDEVYRALNHADIVLVFLSPDLLSNYTVNTELNHILEKYKKKIINIVPLLIRPCILQGTVFSEIKCIPENSISMFQNKDKTYNIIATHVIKIFNEISEKRKGIEKKVSSNLQKIIYNSLPAPKELPTTYSTPYLSLNERFIGRLGDFWRIYDNINPSIGSLNKILIITGMIGIGKTQLAIEYVKRLGYLYEGGILWADVHRGKQSLIDVLKITFKLKHDSKESEDKQLLELWQKLTTKISKPILVVLDNFSERTLTNNWIFNHKSIYYLVISKWKDIGRYKTLHLKPLGVDESHNFLNFGERKFEKDEQMLKLISITEGIPLTLELTKSYLNQNAWVSISEIIEGVDAVGTVEVLKAFSEDYIPDLYGEYKGNMIVTMNIFWGSLSNLEREILTMISLFDHSAPVPFDFLENILNENKKNVFSNPFKKAIRNLTSLSLISNKEKQIHVPKLMLSFAYRKASFEKNVLKKIASELLEKSKSSKNQKIPKLLFENYVPHIEYIIDNNTFLMKDETKIKLLRYLGIHHHHMSRFLLSKQVLERSVKLSEKLLPLNSELRAECKVSLAGVLRVYGTQKNTGSRSLNEAILLLQEALEITKINVRNQKILAENLIPRMFNLARLYFDTKNYNESEDLLNKCITLNDNLDYVYSILGQIYEKKNDMKIAEKYLVKALNISKLIYKISNPIISTRKNMLGLILIEHEKSLVIERGLKLIKEAYNNDLQNNRVSKTTLVFRKKSLGKAYIKIGSHDKALQLLNEAKNEYIKILPTGHSEIQEIDTLIVSLE